MKSLVDIIGRIDATGLTPIRSVRVASLRRPNTPAILSVTWEMDRDKAQIKNDKMTVSVMSRPPAAVSV